MKFQRGEVFRLQILVLVLCLYASSAWAAMSVATLNGTYHGVVKNSSFVQSQDNIDDNISTSLLTMTFNGSGSCTFSENYREFYVNLSSPNVVFTIDESIPSIPCTYTVSPGGQGTLTTAELSGKFNVSADGNVAALSGGEVEVDSVDNATFHDTSIGVFVKAGTGMNNASLNGSYRFVSLESGFNKNDYGIIDFLYANNGTLTFNGNGGVSYSYFNGQDNEVNLSYPDTVWADPGGSESGSGTYSVSSTGLVTLTFPDGQETLRMSSDGNVLVEAEGASSYIDGDGVSYETGNFVAFKVGSGKGIASLNGTYRMGYQYKAFNDVGVTIFDMIESDDPDDAFLVTFFGNGQCEANWGEQTFEVDLNAPTSVFAEYDSGTDSCTYSVSADGQVVIAIPDGDSETWQLSANNNLLLGGGAGIDVDLNETEYGTGLGVMVNAGMTFPKCAQPATINVPYSDPDGSYTVSWDASATGGEIFYVLEEATDPNFKENLRKVARTTQTSWNVSGKAPGLYYYRVKATRLDHRPSSYRDETTGCSVSLSPMTDYTAFINQVFWDFLNRAPDPGGLNYWVSELESGRRTRAQVVEQYLLSPEFGEKIAPVARLYFAYFNRLPDYGGLMFWVNEYSTGNRSLDDISDAFASSPEFQTTYGSLSNSQFVTLVYQNVLGREPEPSGLTFWTSELNTGNRTRGQVMTGFSESIEYKDLMANEIYVTMTYIGLLRRTPEQDGFDYWVSRMDGGSAGLLLIDLFLTSPEYAARFE